jgi:hypothetical protein
LSEAIKVVVEQIPSDTLGLILQISSGILVPIIKLFVSWRFSKGAERRANQYAKNMRDHDLVLSFVERSHNAIERLYYSVQELRLANMRRKKFENWGRGFEEVNDDIMGGSNETAKSMHQESLWRITERVLEAEQDQSQYIVEVRTAAARLEILLGNELTSDTMSAVDDLCNKAGDAGALTEDAVAPFTNAISELTGVIEKQPSHCMKVANQQLEQTR